jgi:hypothetical protein
MPALTTPDPLDGDRLAQVLEDHGQEALRLIIDALRDKKSEAPAEPTRRSRAVGKALGRREPWRQVDIIEGFEHQWPELHEHYGPMAVWESADDQGPVRLAIGEPQERLDLYGRKRGWLSIWQVINGQPRDQRANFVETDDYATSGERIAHIRGKNGNRMAGYAPTEKHLLPAVYANMRIEVQRDRMNGRYAKERLGVVATSDDIEVMLDHALTHLRLHV